MQPIERQILPYDFYLDEKRPETKEIHEDDSIVFENKHILELVTNQNRNIIFEVLCHIRKLTNEPGTNIEDIRQILNELIEEI